MRQVWNSARLGSLIHSRLERKVFLCFHKDSKVTCWGKFNFAGDTKSLGCPSHGLNSLKEMPTLMAAWLHWLPDKHGCWWVGRINSPDLSPHAGLDMRGMLGMNRGLVPISHLVGGWFSWIMTAADSFGRRPGYLFP